jgi:hypothetical protein
LKLINKSKTKIIAKNVIVREGLGVTIGLLPYKTNNYYIYDYLKWKKFGKSDAMMFKVRGKGGVHTWFMSFPISVFFLDKDMKVVDKIKPYFNSNLSPISISSIELPSNSIKHP